MAGLTWIVLPTHDERDTRLVPSQRLRELGPGRGRADLPMPRLGRTGAHAGR